MKGTAAAVPFIIACECLSNGRRKIFQMFLQYYVNILRQGTVILFCSAAKLFKYVAVYRYAYFFF